MTLVRWDPFRELEDMSDRLNRMFSRPALPRTNGKETMVVADWVPSVDVSETEGGYQIKAEIPDVKKEDVKVTLEDGVRKMTSLPASTFRMDVKMIQVPVQAWIKDVQAMPAEEQVKAEFKDGVLNLHLPKSEKTKPKAIEVKVG